MLWFNNRCVEVIRWFGSISLPPDSSIGLPDKAVHTPREGEHQLIRSRQCANPKCGRG